MEIPHTLEEALRQGCVIVQEKFDTTGERRRKGKALLRGKKDQYFVIPFKAHFEFGRPRRRRRDERF